MISFRKRHHTRGDRSGFTLLEVLLTVLLSMILLGGLWSLSNIYLRTFEGGQDLVEQAQLLRAIQQQLNDDLQAIPVRYPVRKRLVPVLLGSISADSGSLEGGNSHGETTPLSQGMTPNMGMGAGVGGEATALPVYSLSGTETAMQMLVCRDVFVDSKAETLEGEEALTGERSDPRLPNWRLVTYQFTPHPDESTGSAEITEDMLPHGLMRREVIWEETVGRPIGGSDFSMDSSGLQGSEGAGIESVSGVASTTPENGEALSEEEEERQKLEEVTEMPQVITCQFRYFDGSVWGTSWEGREGRRLPKAIEVTLQIKPSGAALREQLKREKEPADAIPADDEENTVLQEPQLKTDRAWPTYRQVYFLSNGAGSGPPREGGANPFDSVFSNTAQSGTAAGESAEGGTAGGLSVSKGLEIAP